MDDGRDEYKRNTERPQIPKFAPREPSNSTEAAYKRGFEYGYEQAHQGRFLK